VEQETRSELVGDATGDSSVDGSSAAAAAGRETKGERQKKRKDYKTRRRRDYARREVSLRQIRVEIIYIGVSTTILSGSIGNECTRVRGISMNEKTIEKTSNGRVQSVHHCVVAVRSTKRRRVVESERKRRKGEEREGRKGKKKGRGSDVRVFESLRIVLRDV
jgi:hypothetical protein